MARLCSCFTTLVIILDNFLGQSQLYGFTHPAKLIRKRNIIPSDGDQETAGLAFMQYTTETMTEDEANRILPQSGTEEIQQDFSADDRIRLPVTTRSSSEVLEAFSMSATSNNSITLLSKKSQCNATDVTIPLPVTNPRKNREVITPLKMNFPSYYTNVFPSTAPPVNVTVVIASKMPSRNATDVLTTLTPSSTRNSTEALKTVSMNTPKATLNSTDFLASLSKNEEFYWNKSAMSADVYQNSWCPRRCLHGNIIFTSDIEKKCLSSRCFPCECRRPACEIYDICCPDVTSKFYPPPYSSVKVGLYMADDLMSEKSLKNTPEVYQFFNKNFNLADEIKLSSATERPALGCDVKSSFMKFLYIRSCPTDYLGYEKTMCEMELSRENLTMDWFARAIDTATGVVYKNIYCAKCNKVEQPLQMNVTIKCKHYMTVYTAIDPGQFLRLALMENSTCVVKQDFPMNMTIFTCNEKFFSNTTIGSCPENETFTGNDVINNCLEMKSAKSRVLSRSILYDNLFCSICATNSYPRLDKCGIISGSPGQPSRPPFDFILRFIDDSSVDAEESDVIVRPVCNVTQWPSPNGHCSDLLCSEGKLMVSKNCSTAIAQVTGLEYRVQLLISPSERMHDEAISFRTNKSIEFIFELIQDMFTAVFNNMCEHFWIKIGLVYETKTETNTVVFAWLDGHILATRSLSRDEFETLSIESIKSLFKTTATATLTFVNIKKINVFIDSEDYCGEISSMYTHLYCKIQQVKFPLPLENVNAYQSSDTSIGLSLVLHCSFVRFEQSNYTVHINQTSCPPVVTISLDLQVVTVNLTSAEDLSMLSIDEEGRLSVCHEVLDRRLETMDLRRSDKWLSEDDITKARYILSLICLGISMMCLIMTIVTYAIFQPLRTVAGQNNMCLCLSLLLAQASILLSAHMYGPSPVCTAVGLAVHFLWLWMFAWTFICSFRMFRVFTAKTRASTNNGAASLVKRVFLSVLSPSLIVIGVVVSNYIVSDSKTIGYGLRLCYLNTVFLIGVTMAGPVACIVVSNVTFFMLTVIQVHRIGKLASMDSTKNEDRENLYIYIKLSTMTGVFWVTEFLASATNQEFLRFASILLNGLQGLFLFMSYTANSRVFRYYMALCGKGDITTSSLKTQSERTNASERKITRVMVPNTQ